MNKFFKIGDLVTWKCEEACRCPGELGVVIKLEQMNNQAVLWINWQDTASTSW